MQVTAESHPNIALVKYWGKADIERNLPAVGSLSITLDTLVARTTVSASDDGEDHLILNGNDDPLAARRVGRCLAGLRRFAGVDGPRLLVESEVNFPLSAGLASSAAGFAALVRAADAFYGANADRQSLARLAGAASGSAARSLYGGYVRLDAPDGQRDDIELEPLAGPADWPLRVVIAITSRDAKPVGSTEAMLASAGTSPYYGAWVAGQPDDLALASRAVAERDFTKLADVSESSCLKMHALTMSSRPGILYFSASTVAAIHTIRALRAGGTAVFFTVDAGPQVKAVCLPDDAATVREALQAVTGVIDVIDAGLGPGARVVP